MIRQTPVNKTGPRAFQPAQRVGRVTLFPLFELIKQVLKCCLELLVLSNVDAFFLAAWIAVLTSSGLTPEKSPSRESWFSIMRIGTYDRAV
ncbi:hypothetical protein HB762_28090 (plasmid) [Vibrio campbellii]|uniref:Uncharacterized protein n=1 Tax=Vibrio campbellii TaxID=680 RepID=A0ABY5ILF3_9VIBR|nr:hypothetical protein [Vibrio campbellii]UTZ35125.1 hypothetical protein HB762_28090 [Vibrio campbellii]